MVPYSMRIHIAREKLGDERCSGDDGGGGESLLGV